MRDMLLQGGFTCKSEYCETNPVGVTSNSRFCFEGPGAGRSVSRNLFSVIKGKDPEPPALSDASRDFANKLLPKMERVLLSAEK